MVYDAGLRKRVHPQQWAHDAQSLIRYLKPPLNDGQRLVLAYDEDGLAGACHYRNLAPRTQDEPRVFQIDVLACDMRCQRRGVGSELLSYVMGQIHETNLRLDVDWGVTTYIHKSNHPSKGLAASRGFKFVRNEDDDFELWGFIGQPRPSGTHDER